MELLIFIVTLLGALFLINLILLITAFIVKKAAFGKRSDKNPLLKYFTAEDFGLTARQVELAKTRKRTIRAVIYAKAAVTPKTQLIIFCHGMGPGHVAYTTEIAYFCNLGYTVLAPDYIGCNLSDGKSVGGFASGRITVQCAVEYARHNMPRFDKIFLVGHSWGGWSALCAGSFTQADKIVAISAPDKPEAAVCRALSSAMPKFLAKILYPYVSLLCGDKSAAEAAKWSGAEILLVQGENDVVVPPSNSVYYKVDAPNVKKLLVPGRGHNPYNTAAAEAKLGELSSALAGLGKGTDSRFFDDFDFKAATEEDDAVMGEIARFLEVRQ